MLRNNYTELNAEIKRVNFRLMKSLSDSIELMRPLYFKYMYKDPELSKKIRDTMISYEEEINELKTELRPKENKTDRHLPFRYN